MIYINNIILALLIIIITGFNFKIKNKLEFLLLISFLIPIPVLSFYRSLYLSDFLLLIYSIMYLTNKKKLFSNNIFFRRFQLISFLLIFLIPIFTTYLAFKNGNINNMGNVFFHFFRALMVICVFSKGYEIGYTKSINVIFNIFKMYVFIWFIILVIGLLEFYNILDTNIYTVDKSKFSGFFGMDKPQIALLTVTIFNITLYLSFNKFFVLKYFVIILSPIILFFLGSRQGLLYLTISVILYLFIDFINRDNKIIKLRIILFIFLFSFTIFQSQSFFENNKNFKVLISIFNRENLFIELLNVRDPRFIESFENIIKNNNYLIGNGIGTEELGYKIKFNGTLVADKNVDRTYFEGEIFRVLWATGLLGVVIYFIIFITLFVKSIKSSIDRLTYEKRIIPSILISLVLINFFYSLGQFNIFTTDGQNIPFLYFIWFIFGILYSNLNKPKNVFKLKVK